MLNKGGGIHIYQSPKDDFKLKYIENNPNASLVRVWCVHNMHKTPIAFAQASWTIPIQSWFIRLGSRKGSLMHLQD